MISFARWYDIICSAINLCTITRDSFKGVKMTEQKFQITVKDSVFQTKGAGLHMCLLFAVCFLFQFMVYIILDQVGIIPGKREDIIPLLALVISVLVVCLFY